MCNIVFKTNINQIHRIKLVADVTVQEIKGAHNTFFKVGTVGILGFIFSMLKLAFHHNNNWYKGN